MRIDEPNPTPDAPVDTPDLDTELAASMDAGIEAATEQPEPTGEPPVPGTQEAQAAKDGEGEPAKAEPAKDAKPDGDKPAEAKPEDDATKEAESLGLKGKANERFREMAEEIKTFAPMKAALEQAGIKDVAELPALAKKAKDGDDLVEMVKSTGASPDQFGQTLDYLGLLTAASAGDKSAAEKAFALIEGEYKELARLLGKPIEGIHDPLADYPDLVADVEGGNVTRERALELAQARNDRKASEAAAQRQRETSDTTKREQEKAAEAREAGKASLNALDLALKSDPHYAAKRPLLMEKAKEICAQHPPAQWATKVAEAWAGIPNPASTTAPKPPPGPIRPGGPRPAVTPAVYESPEDALEAGIAAAGG